MTKHISLKVTEREHQELFLFSGLLGISGAALIKQSIENIKNLYPKENFIVREILEKAEHEKVLFANSRVLSNKEL